MLMLLVLRKNNSLDFYWFRFQTTLQDGVMVTEVLSQIIRQFFHKFEHKRLLHTVSCNFQISFLQKVVQSAFNIH